MPDSYSYSPTTLRYRNVTTGRFVSAATVRTGVDATADVASDKLGILTDRLRTGGVTLADWEVQARQIIKDAHVATGIAAKGGKAMMAPADWLVIAREVKQEYGFLHGMAEDIASGKQPIDGRMTARARQYGQASRGTFEAMRTREHRNSGFTRERNIQSAGACDGCQVETARGLVPIGSLIPVGSRIPCRAHCRCSLAFERTEAA